MIYHYGITQQGTYHIDHNLPCQDFHYYKKINDHFAIAAVADGLGSEMYSDIASKIAAEKSVLYCADNISEDDSAEKILCVIRTAFRISLDEIKKVAYNNNHSEDQYDTTLALAVYIHGTVYYGNSGDSGIVVLNQDGRYEPITVQQRDENNCVFPLCFGEERWDFGHKEGVASVLLATDGMLETFFPFLLRGEEVDIYVALAQCFMDESKLHFVDNGEESVQNKMNTFVANIPGSQVNDDKTVVVMVDTAISTSLQPDDYYIVPDWNVLKRKRDEEFRRAAYPQLFGSDSEEKKEEPESTEENITVEAENQTSCDDDKSTEDKEDKIEENYSFDNKSNIADSVQSTIEPKKTIVTQDIVIEKNRIIINCNDQVCYKERITVTFERWYKKGKRVIRKTTKTQKWTKE